MLRRTTESVLILALLLCFFVPISMHRLVAGDEGFYVLAAKLVSSGHSLYSDFFYPQMPLLPWIYGIWMKIFGATWFSARILTAILASLLGVLLYINLSKFGTRWALFGIFLFVTSTLVFAWYSTAKTFPISTLLLFGSYLLLDRQQSLCGWLKFLLAGILFGLSVESRLFFAGLYPIFLLIIFLRPEPMTPFIKSLAAFSVGCALPLLPALYLAISNFDVFYFNNLGYHLIRSGRSEESLLRAKITIFKTVLALRDSNQVAGYQFPMLFILAFLYFLKSLFSRSETDVAFLIALGLFVLNFFPNPSYVQYFSTLVPFLIIAATSCLAYFCKAYMQNTFRPKPGLAIFGLLLFSAAYISGSYEDIQKYLNTGVGVIGISRGEAPHKTIAAMHEIGSKISDSINSGEQVLAEWPGFLVDSTATPVPRLENHFGWKVGHKVSPELRAKYKILSRAEIKHQIESGIHKSVLLEAKSFNRNYKDSMSHYELLWKEHEVMFFKRKA